MAMKLKLEWVADSLTEASLRELSVPFEVDRIAFDRIDRETSQHNGARIGGGIIPHLVVDYKTAMENGNVFHRLLGYWAADGRFVLLGGNQRCRSIKELIDEGKLAKATQVQVYVVSGNDKFLLDIMARTNNVVHGDRNGKEERLAHALFCVRKNGMRVVDAAKSFMVSTTTINSHIKGARVSEELEKENINVSGVSIMTLAELDKIPDDNVKHKVGHLLATHKTTCDRVKQVVGAVKQAGSQAARLRQVKAFEKELTEEAHRVGGGKSKTTSQRKAPSRPRRDELIRRLRQLGNLLDQGMDGQAFTSLAELQISSVADERVVRDEWHRLVFRMTLILKK